MAKRKLITSYEQIVENANNFNDVLYSGGRDSIAYKRFSQFSHWYCFPELDIFAPSKFIGYEGTTIDNYVGADEGNGGVTTKTLDEFFVKAPESEFQQLEGLLRSKYCVPLGKKLNALTVKNGWIYLPKSNRVADQFRAKTQNLPKTTEAERLVVQRVGQDLFRGALLDYWKGRCCVTGLAVPSLLRASHIKPWSKCASDNERLDEFNGLLLAPHLDALFDDGWISFSDQGQMLVSKQLSKTARAQLGIDLGWSIQGLKSTHMKYLAHHREHVFRRG